MRVIYVALVGALAIASLLGRPGKKDKLSDVLSISESLESGARERPVASSEAETQKSMSLSAACRDRVRKISRMPLADLPGWSRPDGTPTPAINVEASEEFIARLELASGGSCEDLPATHELRGAWSSAEAACATAREQLRFERGQAIAACYQAVLAYRLAVLKLELHDANLADIADTRLLMDRVVLGLTVDEGAELQSIASAAERVLEVEPDNSDAARYALKARYMMLKRKGGVLSEGERAALNRDLAAFEKAAPDDPEIFDVKFGVASPNQSSREMRQWAVAESQRDPDSRVAAYYFAWASFAEGKLADAKERLSRQVQRDPDDVRARFTLLSLSNQSPEPFIDLAAHPGALAFTWHED